MKKIMFINSSLTNGGSERVMTLLANELADREYDVSMILLREKGKDTYKLDPRVNCIRFDYKHKNKFAICVSRIIKLRKTIKQFHPDVIISFMIDINVFVLLATLGIRVPVIVSERCDPNQVQGWLRRIEIPVYRRAQSVVFQTSFIQQQYPESIKNKSFVIYNPVSPDIPAPDYHTRKEIVTAGRLAEQKNFPMLIEAFAEFHKLHPDYRLVIYGEGSERPHLEEQVRNMKLDEAVSMPGFVNDVDSRMNGASIFVSSSNYEGISNALLEAMCMGIATIATDCPVGGSKQVIDSGYNGILIPVGDKNALVSALTVLADDAAARKNIQENAVLTRQVFSVEKIADEWEKIILHR